MSILITGGEGLIGSNLFNKLKTANVNKIDIDDYDLTDKGDTDILSRIYCPDVIVHTAAIAHLPTIKKNPFKAINNNILSTMNLLEFAVKRQVKHFIYLSSCSVYGDTPSYTDEESRLKPKGIYGATKACEEMLVTACQKLGLSITILRLSSVYGEGDRHTRVIPNFIKAALSGEPIIVESNVVKEFTYVDDVTNAVILCFDNAKSKGEIFNIHGGQVISIGRLAETIKQIIPGTQIIYKFKNNREQTSRGNISIEKAKEMLGYEPGVNLEEGLRRVIKCYQLNSAG